jgi:hypothetical protein
MWQAIQEGRTHRGTAGFNGRVPTLEELRQLIQLRREIDELYARGNSQ